MIHSQFSIKISIDAKNVSSSRIEGRSFGQALYQALDGDVSISKGLVEFTWNDVAILYFVYAFNEALKDLIATGTANYEWSEGEGIVTLQLQEDEVRIFENGSTETISSTMDELTASFNHATENFWQALRQSSPKFYLDAIALWPKDQ